MRILLVRHGESEGNVDERAYVEIGDQDVALTDKGWRQALRTGDFLRDFYVDRDSGWPTIYSSPYMRTQQTLSGIMHGLRQRFPDDPIIREEVDLIEQYFGAGYLLRDGDPRVDETWAEQYNQAVRATLEKNPITTPYPLGQSLKAHLSDVRAFMEGPLARQVDKGHDDFLIVTHGMVIRNLLFCWKHLQIRDHHKIPMVGNGDVVSITGSARNWTIRKIYDSANDKEVDWDLLQGLEPIKASELPQPPQHILDECQHSEGMEP